MGEAEALAALAAIPGLSWRPLDRAELSDVHLFYAECEAFDHNPERTSLAQLEEYWDAPRSRPDEDILVGREDEGRVVATAWSGCNRAVTERRGVYLGGSVHPDRRGEGIGRTVLAWELAHALEWDDATREPGHGPLALRLYVPAEQADVRDLAERHGLSVQRYFVEMSRSLDELEPTPGPGSVRLVDWAPDRSEEVHRVVDGAFRGSWGHVDRTDEMWTELTSASSFRPVWSVLALDPDTGAVVGAALNAAYEQDWGATGVREGYTDELAVARSHRGRGVASALLRESMRRFASSGMTAAGLAVDVANPSGALRLYESLGYAQAETTCVHELTRP